MKGITVAACIFALISFVFCTISFGATEVIHNKYTDGNPGELHAEYPDLTVELPLWGLVTADVTLYAEWLGSETIVNGPRSYHHVADVKTATAKMKLEFLYPPSSSEPIEIQIKIDIVTGTMNEHGPVENISVAPGETKLKEVTDADMFFRATSILALVPRPPWYPGQPDPVPISLGPGQIRLEDGEIKFLQVHDIHPAPRKSNVRITTFGRIKSK